MSWQEQIQREIVIITGDRKRYTPLWINPLKKLTFNVSSFNFPNVKGSLVKKFQPQGNQYPLEIYFQGENHIEVAKEFEKSCDDTRHWHILHPYYGDLRVQPSELTFDDTNLNVTKVTGIMLETLANNFPNSELEPIDEVAQKKETTDLTIATNFDINTKDTNQKEIVALAGGLDLIYQTNLQLITTDEDSKEYRNLYLSAKRQLVLTGYNSINAITEIQKVINYPTLVAKSVNVRVASYVTQINRLTNSIKGISDIPKNLKLQYECLVGTILGGLATIVVNKNSDSYYGTKKDVVRIIEEFITINDLYLDTLDFLQTDNSQEVDSYSPSFESQNQINELVNLAISNLFEIALNSKQERSIFLKEDDNLINITYKYLGLDSEDKNLNEFIRVNEIGISEHLLLKKGRKIIYFV